MSMLSRSSLGMTILPKSSTGLVIPVYFMFHAPFQHFLVFAPPPLADIHSSGGVQIPSSLMLSNSSVMAAITRAYAIGLFCPL